MNAGGTGAWDLSLLNLAPAGVPVAAAAVSGVGRTGGRGSGSVTPQLPVALLPDRGQPLFAPPPALGALLRRHFRGVRCHNAPLGVVAAAAVAGPRRGAEVVRGALVPPHGMRDHLSAGRAGQGAAGQGRAGQGRAGQGGAGQGRAGQGIAGQGRAGQGRAGQGRAGQGRAGQGRAGHRRAGQGRAGQGRAGQGRAGQGRAVQGRAGQGRAGGGRAGLDLRP